MILLLYRMSIFLGKIQSVDNSVHDFRKLTRIGNDTADVSSGHNVRCKITRYFINPILFSRLCFSTSPNLFLLYSAMLIVDGEGKRSFGK